MADIQRVFAFIMDSLRSVFNLYTGSFILASVLGLWLFRKVVNYFKYLIH